MKDNGESIYGTQASPFKKLEWGRCTQKVQDGETILYLHVFDWPKDGKLVIPGLTNKIVRAYALNDIKKKKLQVEKSGSEVAVAVSNLAQSNYSTVIVLKIKGKPVVTEQAKILSFSR
jgi:alpha-L-fucosidase